jgi:hypothetical protein
VGHGKVDFSLSYYNVIFVVLTVIIVIINKKNNMYLCLINQALRHEGIRKSVGIAPLFLTSAIDGGEWSDLRFGRFATGKRTPGTHWIGDWVGPTVDLDAFE